jgi:REP element-mobilizing transposase RayT
MTRYDPRKHHRRSIRLPGYDYRSPGAYFVTVCVRQGDCLLGEVVDGQMQLSAWGQVADRQWRRIPQHFSHVQLDEWVVMPNHVHGILIITGRVGVGRGEASTPTPTSPSGQSPPTNLPVVSGFGRDASPLQGTVALPNGAAAGSLGAIVGNWKSVTTRRINRMRHTPGVPFWQRNYWEHIIRTEDALHRIRAYIRSNPARWAEDQLHPDAAPSRINRWPRGE